MEPVAAWTRQPWFPLSSAKHASTLPEAGHIQIGSPLVCKWTSIHASGGASGKEAALAGAAVFTDTSSDACSGFDDEEHLGSMVTQIIPGSIAMEMAKTSGDQARLILGRFWSILSLPGPAYSGSWLLCNAMPVSAAKI